MISINALSNDIFPVGTCLLGGTAGLERLVTNTARFRARTPAFHSLRGGEIALVPFPLLALTGETGALVRLVTQLSGAGISGIVVFDLDLEHPLVDEASRESDLRSLPLFLVPKTTNIDSLDLDINRYLAELRERLIRSGQALQQRFTSLALSGQGLRAIVAELSDVTRFPVAWEDEQLYCTEWALPETGWPRDLEKHAPDIPALLRPTRLMLRRWMVENRRGSEPSGVFRMPLVEDGHPNACRWHRLVAPVGSGTDPGGFLSVIVPDSGNEMHPSTTQTNLSGSASPSRLDISQETRSSRRGFDRDPDHRVALEAASVATSMEVIRRRTIDASRGATIAGLALDWIGGQLVDDATLASRAGPLGMSLHPPYIVAVVESSTPVATGDLNEIARALSGEGPRRASTRVPLNQRAPLIWAPVGSGRVAVIVGNLDENVSLRTTIASLNALFNVSQNVSDGFDPTPSDQRSTPGDGTKDRIRVGLGRPVVRVDEVIRSYREAQRACDAVTRFGGRAIAASFQDIGIYRLLATVDPAELDAYCTDHVGALRDHDARTNGDLCQTLEVYLRCGGRPQEAASLLHTHRNTVLYRIERIEEILGINVRDPETQLILSIALRSLSMISDSIARANNESR